ncbi:MAG: tRNA guanosine(34) transglycosylase Tgt [Tannerellaceae bacterium]|jgi:queuine tRNA-ribosyltransferase|nr:tRNA guanosine(34) transglycosylase Tgt [Tannerellaceae bacterium]
MKFGIEYNDSHSNARAGRITTGHGVIETPVFMPVGTQGAVKAVHISELKDDIKAQIILGNTYHLYLRPGTALLERVGGLHKFNGWDRPILTDSGGYQVFSLSGNRKLKDEGAEFRSHIDGSKHFFSPEKVVDIQRSIGADIIMAFDECCPGDAGYEYAEKSLRLTEQWLDRCIDRMNRTEPLYGYEQCLFPIVQGCVYTDLRQRASEYVAAKNAGGNAIGGLAVGEPTEKMYEMIEVTNAILPKDKPRYLMGVGTPVNLLESIGRGVDMFDCIMPTRNGRNGQLFTRYGTINIRNRKWEDDFSPLDPDASSFVDTLYTKAYLHHLMKTGEISGLQIASIHNLAFYLRLMREARAHIIAGDFTTWKNESIRQLSNRL